MNCDSSAAAALFPSLRSIHPIKVRSFTDPFLGRLSARRSSPHVHLHPALSDLQGNRNGQREIINTNWKIFHVVHSLHGVLISSPPVVRHAQFAVLQIRQQTSPAPQAKGRSLPGELPDMMSASEGGRGLTESGHSKGGCVNFIV